MTEASEPRYVPLPESVDPDLLPPAAEWMTVQYGVITKVPDPGTDDGNLCSAMVDIFVKVGEHPASRRNLVKLLPDVVGVTESLRYMKENFQVGEILVMDPYGREYGYPGRKPDKWNVTCEHFATVEEAIRRSREVSGAYPV